ncbi:hypothetical protein CN221_33490 [Sinorhizobium meliloti]|uniref:hypothetical protein n=1 Tax=Rhizobium meliloti TaxID=382 RepID=UPI000FE08191|nr:hypothetical protein [Sinorhizobium meliloti]MCM5689193.1 hypothetical protein [Sinorhizobium meliloti]RVG84194.1 hypothetical protein CN221_33490 [Sinorhizobium meliloti]RVH50055.1 hypothetical protein CN209_38500 [Sinorhizobium meliloti]
MERATLSPTRWTASGPVGTRCIALLRRVRASGDAYTLIRNVDRDAVVKALAAGFVAWVGQSLDHVRLTERGAAYLDRLARVE